MTGHEDLTGRLRRLRRDERGVSGPASSRAELPERARRLLAGRERRSASEVAAGREPEREGARTVGRPAGLERRANAQGSFAVRTRRFADGHRHGAWRLDEVDAARMDGVVLLAKDPALEGLDPRDACYLDIETTGLSGGAGTMAFLVALGTFEEHGFVLYQGFLEGPEEEAALLADVAERIARRAWLVTFFGKSFDRHRLEDKMRVHGIEPPFAGRPHLDLYHPLRRLYGGAWGDGRLSTLERELCCVQREDDLSGRYAPEAWFDYLAGRAHRLEDVFRHNEDDVLSLVVLAAHLGRVGVEERARGGDLGGSSAHRAVGLARRLAEERRQGESLVWLERALARGAVPARPLQLFRARLLLRLGRADEADDIHAALAREAEDEVSVRALLALSRRAEHTRHDPTTALAHVRRAARTARRASVARRSLLRELDEREARLARLVR